MAASSRFVLPYQTVIDGTGVPIPGAQLYFYISTSSTPKNTYADSGLTTPNTNPVVANDAGMFPNIFLASGNYRVVLTDSIGDQIWTADPVSSAVFEAGNSLLVFSSDPAYTTLAQADAAAVAIGGALVIDRNWSLVGNTALSSKQVFFGGGVITLGNFSLTFNRIAVSAGATQIFSITGSGAVLGNMLVPAVLPEWWGAKSDGTSSAATLAAFQAANDYVAQSADLSQTIRLLGASYNLGSGTGVVKASSFYAPNWVGNGKGTAGGGGTLITFTPVAEAAAFVFVGGSGSLCGGGVKDVIFSGNGNAIGVELRGQGGANIDIAIFSSMKLAVLLHNKDAATFSEFNKLYVDSNGSLLTTILEYRVTSGNASFHGSGLVGGTMNYGNGNAPAVLIGAAAFPYAAPLNADFFPTGSGAAVLIQNNSNTGFGEPYFIGTVSVEQGSATSVKMGQGSDFILVGGQTFFGNSLAQAMANMYLADTFGTTGSSLGVVAFKTIYRATNVVGATTFNWPVNGQNQSWAVSINVFGAGYNVNKTVNLILNAANGNFTQTGAIDTTFDNTAAYGTINITAANSTGITFQGNSSPYPGTGLVYTIALKQIDQSISFHGN